MNSDINSLFFKIKSEKNMYCPLSAEIDVTYGCPCKCIHCYQENNRLSNERELNTNEILKLIDDLHDLGTFECIISGGDPLCRNDIWEILNYLENKKIRTILYTSGIFLSEQICRKIYELHIARVEMTLLGACAEVHDQVCCLPGSYNKIVEGINYLTKYNVPIRLKYMLMHNNYSELKKLEVLEKELDNKIEVIPYLWCKQGGKEQDIEALRITEAEMIEFYNKYPFPKKEKTFINCNAGKYKVAIDAWGNVKACSAFSKTSAVGNIKQNSIKEIWTSSEVLKKMRKTIRYPIAICRQCQNSAYCVLCPAISTWAGKQYGEIYLPMCKYAECAKGNANE